MKFSERLHKSKILVIGAHYGVGDHSSIRDLHSNNCWNYKDQNYIGIAREYGHSNVQFEDGNPFNTDWNRSDFLDLLKNNLKDKKFEEIWIDRGTIHHFLDVQIQDSIFKDWNIQDFATLDPLVIRQKSRNLMALHYLLENHATDNCKFFMPVDESFFSGEENNALTYLEAYKIQQDPDTASIYALKMLFNSNRHHFTVTQALKGNLILESAIEKFRDQKFNSFKVVKPKVTQKMQVHDLSSSSNANVALGNNSSYSNILTFDFNQYSYDEQLAKQLQKQLDLEESAELAEEFANAAAIRQAFMELNPGMSPPRR